ncbi:MAG: c-type cytochrome, partial [Steroidobacteraceae bacterium]
MRLLLILVFGCRLGVTAAAGIEADAQLGERLFRTGVGVDGTVIAGVVQNDVPAIASAAACANCHRRSGLGTSEGRNRAPAITAPRTSAYDENSLRRVLVEGVTPDGRMLDPLMPHYRLGDRDVAALLAYLKTLGANADPGVTPTHVRLVTIVADSAPEGERESVVRVITRFAEIKNSGTRREADRAAASRRQAYGERHIRGYRVWDVG